MPPYSWPVDPMDLVRQFEARHKDPAAGALLAWAVWAVDSLHYLDDVDRAFDAAALVYYFGHLPDVVDVSHARWATGTCITSLDLCAAGLARVFCGHARTHELDLVDFDPSVGSSATKRRAAKRRGQLPSTALGWVDAVLADPDYSTVKAARNSLTHSRLPRHFVMAAGGPPQRLSLELPAIRLPVRRLVELSRDVATGHITDLVSVLPGL